MTKMSGIHYLFVFRLGGSMLKCPTDILMNSGSRGVRIKFGHFFVLILLYSNIKKQFA